MEIRKWHLYILINCALVYCGLAKPFSLNEVIAAESQQKQVAQTTLSPKLEVSASERFSLNKSLRNLPLKSRKFKETATGSILSLDKIDSPLKYRKAFQIKSPLRPRRRNKFLTRNKRKNLSKKREINGNEKLNRKYIPLLKNIGMLFDDILGDDSSESFETERGRRRLRYYLEPISSNEKPCSCSTRSNSKPRLDSEEAAATISKSVSSEISIAAETTTETTDTTTPIHIRSFRQNKNVPLLLPRNTFSAWRNNNGLRKRNRAAHHRGIERNIPRNNGISKHNTRNRENKFSAESNEEDTDSHSRDDESRSRYVRSRIRGGGNFTRNHTQTVTAQQDDDFSEVEDALDDPGRNDDEHQRENKLQIGRNETKSAELLSKPFRGSGEYLLEKETDNNTESLQSKESNEESDVDVSLDISGNQRIVNRSGSITKENKKIGEGNETVITKEIFTKAATNQGPVVVIIDGYSVTRHKNGENKLSEKSIQIQSN